MKAKLLANLRAAAAEWASLHNVEAVLIEAKYSGIGSNVHIRVVARSGFESWPRSKREHDLFDFLHAKINGNGDFFISSLITMTEEEYEKYEGVVA